MISYPYPSGLRPPSIQYRFSQKQPSDLWPEPSYDSIRGSMTIDSFLTIPSMNNKKVSTHPPTMSQ